MPPSAHSKKILIIDDNPDIREAISTVLEDEGFKTVIATQGQEGLETLRSHPDVSLILLDMQMPVMDGPTFLLNLQEELGPQKVPVVVFAATLVKPKLPGINPNAVKAWLPKPVSLTRLLDTVQRHCPIASTDASLCF